MSVINKIVTAAYSRLKEFRFLPLRGVSVFGANPFNFEFERLGAILKGYGQNPYVFAVINRIVERAVDIPHRVIDEDKEEIETPNPFFTALLTNPNDEGLKETLYRLFANYLANEAFVVETTTVGFEGKITGWIVPNSQDVQINVDAFGNVLSYDYTYLGRSSLSVTPDKVLHVKRPDITSQLRNGRGNLIAGAKVYQSNNEVWGSEAALHKNKGITGVLYQDGNRPATAKEQKELQEKYDQDHTGERNFGKVKVSPIKLGYLPMGMNPNDLKSIEARLDHLRAVCMLYNVDSKLFNDPSASTYNNMPAAKLGLITDAVLPMLNKIMTELFQWLSEKVGEDYFYQADLEDVPEMQTAKEVLSARLGREVVQGILPKEEARAILYPHLVSDEEENPTEPLQDNGETTPVSVQDVLSIQAAVVAGNTSREGAIVLLMQLYGFDEDTANEILGEPNNE